MIANLAHDIQAPILHIVVLLPKSPGAQNWLQPHAPDPARVMCAIVMVLDGFGYHPHDHVSYGSHNTLHNLQ